MSEADHGYRICIASTDSTPETALALASAAANLVGHDEDALAQSLLEGPLVVSHGLGFDDAQEMARVMRGMGLVVRVLAPDEPSTAPVRLGTLVGAGLLSSSSLAALGGEVTQPFDPSEVEAALQAELARSTLPGGMATEGGRRDAVGRTGANPSIVTDRTDPMSGADVARALLESSAFGDPASRRTFPQSNVGIGRTLAFGSINLPQPESARRTEGRAADAVVRTGGFDPVVNLPPPVDVFATDGPPTLQGAVIDASQLNLEAGADFGEATEPGTSSLRTLIDPRQRGAVDDPFAFDPGLAAAAAEPEAGRHSTLPRVPHSERPPPMVAPRTPADPVASRDPMETGTLGSIADGPLVFRLASPPPQVTETGTLPKAARGAAGSLPPAAAVPPPSLTDEQARSRAERTGAAERGRPEPRPDNRLPRRRVEPFDLLKLGEPAAARVGPTSARLGDPNHDPNVAAGLSLVLPGMGQVYNGQYERGGWYALGALLVVPWLVAVADAWLGARDIADGRRPPPNARVRKRAVASQLALNIAVLFVVVGAIVLYNMRAQNRAGRSGQVEVLATDPLTWPPPVPPSDLAEPAKNPAAAVGEDAGVDAAAEAGADTDGGLGDADVEVGGAGGEGAEGDEPGRSARAPVGDDLPVETLMDKGRMALSRELYDEAEALMRAVLERDPQHPEAWRLLVQAKAREPMPPPPDAGAPAVAPDSTPASSP